MCGIFGVLGNQTDLTLQQFQSCLQLMHHRGPDEQGVKEIEGTNVNGYLGHVRLSIIDLVDGKQPMINQEKKLILSYNGEIYNYKSIRKKLEEKGYLFNEHSDTEVLLNAYIEWGGDCVNYFRGMFAFAIWDGIKQKLVLARDHFGKKPLFYYEKEGQFVFSSEIKSLLALPEKSFSFNEGQVNNYLLYRYVPSPNTFISEISKLPPGSILVYENNKATIKKYYSPFEDTNSSKNLNNSKSETTTEFWSLLDEAVSLRMVADVPFGAFLSGGIDSSAIVALMCRHSDTKIKTFSVGFKESNYSELQYAEVIAKQFETEHHELEISQDDLMLYLPKLIDYRDAPVCEPSDIPIYLLAKEASKTVKMVLTGEGSDEILGGYPKHLFESFVPIFQLLPNLLRENVIAPLIQGLPYKFRRAKTAIKNINTGDFNERMPSWFGGFNLGEIAQLTKLKHQQDLPSIQQNRHCSSLQNILCFDQNSWLPDNLLERGDRMLMAASIEGRMPFMDIELAKFAASLPDKFKINGRTTKWILRKSMEGVLPKEILDRPKVGFRVPVNEWFQTSMKDYLQEHLLGTDSITKNFYHINVLQNHLSEHINGVRNHEKTLWALLNLELWLKQNQNNINI